MSNKEEIAKRLEASFARQMEKVKFGTSAADNHNEIKREQRRLACKRYNNSEHGRAKNREYKRKNREKYEAARKKWLEKHPGYDTQKKKEYRKKHPESYRAFSKKYYEKHKDEVLRRQKEKIARLSPEEQEELKKKKREYYRQWRAKNKDKIKGYRQKRKQKKNETN